MMRYLTGTIFPLIALATWAISTPAAAQEPPKFDLPLDCVNGPTCFLQNMVDMDRSDKRMDALCGRSTYNGHKGTDFRVDDLITMREGINVIAMADGKVVGLRNTAADRLVETKKHRRAVAGKECGNGAMFEHGRFGGKMWTTQYCHLRKGSVNLKPGQLVKKGDVIGQIGLSGFTTFPHVHVTFRQGKQIIDPFTGLAVKPRGGNCSADNHKPLFSTTALEQLKAKDSPLIKAGFASAAVGKKDVMKGKVVTPRNRRPLVFYTLYKNLLKGDRVQIIIRVGKAIWMQQTTEPLKVDKASYSTFAGRRKGGLKNRIYVGFSRILRGDEIVFESKPIAIKYTKIGPQEVDPKLAEKEEKKKKK